MTKEEMLKQEAEEWINKWELCNKCDHKVQCIEDNAICPQVVERAYLASAKPREKRIAELEAQIEKMKWHDLRTDPNDLPKDRHNVWIVYLNGYYQEERSAASYRHKFWVIGGLKTECEVIAWCELPKWEIKEK